ncbi:MAG: hypothetical protein IJ405_03365, partial [Lachnospiraceae bacterium]|nr:hypothetical protein [Lachnospiraceae bacterium]
ALPTELSGQVSLKQENCNTLQKSLRHNIRYCNQNIFGCQGVNKNFFQKQKDSIEEDIICNVVMVWDFVFYSSMI